MKRETLQQANVLAGEISGLDTDLHFLNSILEQGSFVFAIVDPQESMGKGLCLDPKYYPMAVSEFIGEYIESLRKERAKLQEQFEQL